MEEMEIVISGEVVEFRLQPHEHGDEYFTDEGRPGLMVGRRGQGQQLVGYMTYHLPQLYSRILHGLNESPIEGTYRVRSVDNDGHISTPNIGKQTFAEIVRWVYQTFFHHADREQDVPAAYTLAPSVQSPLVVAEQGERYRVEDEGE